MESAGRSGTVGYVAPEILAGKASGLPGDVYAFGILLFESLALQSRYEDLRNGVRAISWDEIERRVVTDGLRPSMPEYITAKSVRKVITMCWDQSPDARPDMHSVVGYLIDLQKDAERRAVSRGRVRDWH